MTDDLTRRLRNLRETFELGDIDREAYERGLERLRTQYGVEVDALLPALAGDIEQTVSGAGAAGVAGDASHSPVTTGDENTIIQAEHDVTQVGGDMIDGDTVSGSATTEGDNYGQTIGVVSHSTVLQQFYTTAPEDEAAKERLKRYLNSLTRTCEVLPLSTADASRERPLALQDVYIALDATYHPPHSFGREDEAIAARGCEPERRTVLSVFCDEQYSPPPHLLLLGNPGSGKSTVVNHLALCLAEANLCPTKAEAWLERLPAWSYGGLLPVRVVLREFAEWVERQGKRHGAELLSDFLQDSEVNSTPVSTETVRLLETHLLATPPQAVLLFDGLDEVVGTTVLPRTVEMIWDVATSYRDAPLLVTCRVLDYRDSDTRQRLVNQHGLRRSDLLPLSDDQIERFVRAWYAGYRIRGRRIWGDEVGLLAALKRRPELREMADNPLLLTMMAMVHANSPLPETRAELYHRCIEQLLIEWRSEPGQPDVLDRLALPTFRREELLRLMARLGYETHTNADRDEASRRRPSDLGRDQALAVIEKVLNPHIRGDNCEQRREQEGGEIIQEIAPRNGRLLKHSERVYRFAHRSFQEFLAGYHLMNSPDAVQQWLHHTADIHWHEVLRLMVGYMVSGRGETERSLQLVSRLNERSEVERTLAGELLHLVGASRVESYNDRLGEVDSPPLTVWEDTLASLVSLVEGSDATRTPAALRVRAAEALGDLGDPRIPLTPEQWEKASAGGTTDPLHRYWCHVEAGDFWFGDESENEKLRPMTLSYPSVIARYPLTNTQYAQFIKAEGYKDERWWTKQGWTYKEHQKWTQPRYWSDTTYNHPTQPAVGISWYEAVAYCRWLTAQGHVQGWLPQGEVIRLPTSREWERAARGTDQQLYPWGSEEPTPNHANYKDTGIGAPSPVGCFPLGAAPCGALDMAGNVWEWTATPSNQDAEPQPQGDFAPGDWVQQEGGSFYSGSLQMHCNSRYRGEPLDKDFGGGFRLFLPSNLCSVKLDSES